VFFKASSEFGQNFILKRILKTQLGLTTKKKRSVRFDKFQPLALGLNAILNYMDQLNTIIPKPQAFKETCFMNISKILLPNQIFTCPMLLETTNGQFSIFETRKLTSDFLEFTQQTTTYYIELVKILEKLLKLMPTTNWQKLKHYFQKFSLSVPQHKLFLAFLLMSIMLLIKSGIFIFLYVRLRWFTPVQDHPKYKNYQWEPLRKNSIHGNPIPTQNYRQVPLNDMIN
jgi:hypothetical protein